MEEEEEEERNKHLPLHMMKMQMKLILIDNLTIYFVLELTIFVLFWNYK